MRTEKELVDLILTKAESDQRIRGVLLNGSRVNPEVKPDKYQDFDIVYLVNDVTDFTKDHRWVHYFGKPLIMQLPTISTLSPVESNSFTYLMQFEDGNRIDLTLTPMENYLKQETIDSLTKVLVDKDKLLSHILPANASAYYVTKPTEHEFQDCINEFWWVLTYVGKGLAREEITYAKAMQDGPVRDMLMLALNWKIGWQHEFQVNLGKDGKFLQNYLSQDEWTTLLSTYSDGDLDSIWKSVFIMCDFFKALTNYIGLQLDYVTGIDEQPIIEYLESLR
ncbi:aminoglycoside 6-adenylyltransferase [Carnobacterium gallinarum]|uniref:aminoglycoside 6-adenylyltransferase n=1 Tax=Carnobacterium gallinarum TaxID=2749 RepID=UPI000551A074|nr:aminoglycoside 6-adenylyltransferase [Carnobacterium gallinarum]